MQLHLNVPDCAAERGLFLALAAGVGAALFLNTVCFFLYLRNVELVDVLSDSELESASVLESEGDPALPLSLSVELLELPLVRSSSASSGFHSLSDWPINASEKEVSSGVLQAAAT